MYVVKELKEKVESELVESIEKKCSKILLKA